MTRAPYDFPACADCDCPPMSCAAHALATLHPQPEARSTELDALRAQNAVLSAQLDAALAAADTLRRALIESNNHNLE